MKPKFDLRSIDITSIPLNQQLLTHLIELAEAGEFAQLTDAGLSPELINALRTKNIGDILRIAGSVGVFSVSINVPRLDAAVRTCDQLQQDSQDVADLVRAGATALFLSEVFRIPLREAEIHCQFLPSAFARAGRPSMPGVDEREDIQAWWHTHSQTPLRQRWIELHKSWPDYSIPALCAVINEFNV